MAAEPAVEDLYYYISFCEFNPPYACWALRCNGIVLIVEVEGDELKNWSQQKQFLKLLQDAFESDIDAEESLFDLIYEPCTAVLRKMAPQIQDKDSFTLQRYYDPRFFVYKLAGEGEGIKAIRSLDVRQHPTVAMLLP